MLRYTQPYLHQAVRKGIKKNVSNHTPRIKEIQLELLSEAEEQFFLTLQSRLPVLTIT